MITYFNEEPDAIVTQTRPDGLMNVWLRKDSFAVTDEEGNTQWGASEVYSVGNYNEDDLDRNFDKYWRQFERAELGIPTRVSALEDLAIDEETLDAIESAICELYEAMIGE